MDNIKKCEICGKPANQMVGVPQGFNGKKWEYINMTQVGIPCCTECGDKITDI
jgi:hypothetical protein